MFQKFVSISLVVFLTTLWVKGSVCSQELDWDSLNRGQIIVEDATNIQDVHGLRAYFIVEASAERVWDVLTDYENFAEVFKGIDKVTVLSENKHGAKVEFWVSVIFKKSHYVLHRKYEKPNELLTWKRASGDLKVIEGSWEIKTLPDSENVMLIYSSFVDIGGIIPTRLVRWHAKREVSNMAERLRSWLVFNSVVSPKRNP